MMRLTLDDLANNKPFCNNEKITELFKSLDNVCTENDASKEFCDSFQSRKPDKPYNMLLQQTSTILKRNKEKHDTYFKDIIPNDHTPCIYFKYWLYNKFINGKFEDNDIKEFYYALSENIAGIYRIWDSRCKFHATNLVDVKILKVLYDYILFPRSVDEKNVIEEIEKCEFCEHLKSRLKSIFRNNTIACSMGSSIAFCMEHNEFFTKYFHLNKMNTLSCKYDENMLDNSQCPKLCKLSSVKRSPEPVDAEKETETMQENPKFGTDHDNLQGNNPSVYTSVAGLSVLGMCSILFYLYKFTSLGSSIQHRTKGILNKWNNLEDNDVLLNTSETENTNLENIPYNIAYIPVQDY
ncbi:PIR Superfamily Protein [Plasmodium ovale wallikeri]|uniref:PIR Superfamily Protein n=1 Tax=Plasmodium ovale wallikeri TaxID=864142 RepID=A0A1A8YZ35_PLAOA|nr:PIR Superfamily Protein [Plasmodium ovale wallikeri]SBT57238.1 PIR Superfamily Protein [Plasmodium ovale wallikeri]